MKIQELRDIRKNRFKWAFSTRNVEQGRVATLLSGALTPVAGDLVPARVDRLGRHRKLELTTSRRADLFEGDEIVVAFGNRYAPDQFETIVPDQLEPCHLIAAGGVAGTTMNAGKTTACTNLVKGFARRGLRVAAAKITGTGDVRLEMVPKANHAYESYLAHPPFAEQVFSFLFGPTP